MLVACAFALLAPLACLHAAEAPRPRNAAKLIVINDDGFSSFYSGHYKTGEDLRKQMLKPG